MAFFSSLSPKMDDSALIAALPPAIAAPSDPRAPSSSAGHSVASVMRSFIHAGDFIFGATTTVPSLLLVLLSGVVFGLLFLPGVGVPPLGGVVFDLALESVLGGAASFPPRRTPLAMLQVAEAWASTGWSWMIPLLLPRPFCPAPAVPASPTSVAALSFRSLAVSVSGDPFPSLQLQLRTVPAPFVPFGGVAFFDTGTPLDAALLLVEALLTPSAALFSPSRALLGVFACSRAGPLPLFPLVLFPGFSAGFPAALSAVRGRPTFRGPGRPPSLPSPALGNPPLGPDFISAPVGEVLHEDCCRADLASPLGPLGGIAPLELSDPIVPLRPSRRTSGGTDFEGLCFSTERLLFLGWARRAAATPSFGMLRRRRYLSMVQSSSLSPRSPPSLLAVTVAEVPTSLRITLHARSTSK